MEPRGIFISYRREQTAAHAGRLYDRLSDAFGERAVFMDVGDREQPDCLADDAWLHPTTLPLCVSGHRRTVR